MNQTERADGEETPATRADLPGQGEARARRGGAEGHSRSVPSAGATADEPAAAAAAADEPAAAGPARNDRRRRLVQALMGVCVLALLPATWMFLTTQDRLHSTADVPPTAVGVVFGAGLWDGEPSPYLAHRLDTAAQLYRSGRIKVVLVTGDNSRKDYDEPDAMRSYLTRHGVPRARVVNDYAGFDTWDSCVRARKVFGVHRAILISQGFHIRRAVALCRAAGITPYGVGVADPHDMTWYYGATRELFAAGKAALDAVFQPDPRFLGPHESGVSKALRAAS